MVAVMLLLVMPVVLVSAEGYLTIDGKTTVVQLHDDTFFGRLISNLKYLINKGGAFSVYGDALDCDKYPTDIVQMKNGQKITFTGNAVPTGAAFINLFYGSPYDGVYDSHRGYSREPLGEQWVADMVVMGTWKSVTYEWTCDAGAYWDSNGDGIGECYVDYYACDKPCYGNSACQSGETCDTSILSSSPIPSLLGYRPGVCYAALPTHSTEVYSCSEGTKTKLGVANYGTSYSWCTINGGIGCFCSNSKDTKYLLGSVDKCLSYVPDECIKDCVITTCEGYANSGKNCGLIDDGCGTILNCGSCLSGQTCINNHCTNNENCFDGLKNQDETGIDCGGTCLSCECNKDGKCNNDETCSTCPEDCGKCGVCDNDGKCEDGETIANCPNDCKDTPSTCGDGVCQRGEQQYSSPSSLNPDYCKKDCPVDPPVKASIYDVVLSDSQGNYISSDDELQPGEMVTVKFKVRVKYEDFKLRLKESLPDLFVGGALPLVPWSYDSRMEYNIETGIIPASTAIDWFGKDANVQTFSINNLFAVSQRESECCEGQTNILADKTKYTQNWAGQTWRAIWDNQQEYVVSEHEIQIQVPSSTTKDLCPMEGGLPSKYWDPDSGVYILYIDIKNGCFAENGVFTGYTNPQDAYFSITLNVNGSEEYEGKKCEINADCGPNGFCLPCSQLPKGSCKWYEYLGKRCSSTSNETEINTTTASKFPLTKEEIKTSTSGDLLSAACYYDTDCAKRTNYTSDCIPVASLVEEGTMTASGKDDLFSSGKNLLTVGFAGAGIGTTLCMVGVGLSSVTLGASTLVGCGVSGALIAVSAVQGISKLPSGVDKDSVYSKELQKAINDGDSNKVGICTATPETKPFDIKGWLEKIGGYVKITGTPMIDGIIIVIIGFFLVSTILKGIGGKSEGGRR